MVTIGDPWADVPRPQAAWVSALPEERLRLVQAVLDSSLIALEAHPDGRVVVELQGALNAAGRGELLRKAELVLKALVDPGLMVWLQPRGDLNRLRQLRGVKVKDERT